MNSCSDFHLLLLLLLPISLPFLTFVANAQTYRNISLGSSLSAGKEKTSWASPSGEFAFGFHSLPETDLFVLSIWFDKMPERTVVWSANGGEPVQRGSKVEFTTTGELLLTDPQGREVWKRYRGTPAAYASLLDTGNLVLVDNANFDYIWQSFEEPTNTILPTQMLRMDSKLFLRQTETNFTRGRFMFIFQIDGNLVLYPVSLQHYDGSITAYRDQHYDPYWASNTVGKGNLLMFNQSGSIALRLINGTTLNLTSSNNVPPRDFYQRATLDFDGVFRQYAYPKTSARNGSWKQAWSVLDSIGSDICMKSFSTGSGVCGFNSYCRLDENSRPSCNCPPNYTELDPNNKFKGCRPDFVWESCGDQPGSAKDSRPKFEMDELVNTDWPLSDFELYRSVSEDTCREACLDDCLCQVAIFRDGNCWKKRLPLSNGRMAAGIGGKALIKVRRDNMTTIPSLSGQPKNKQKPVVLILYVLLGGSVSLNLLFLSTILLCVFMVKHKKQMKLQTKSNLVETNLRSFTYKELEKATNGFQDELGKGTSGTVYKGVLTSSEVHTEFVAVKKLERMPDEKHDEFKNEMKAIGRVHHKNLVPLLGFCEEGSNRLLVYEFMVNGSLANFLFGGPKPTWNKRIQLASSIARGLFYLHEECGNQIIHCNIKPQNILLDKSFTARICDFGIAKLLNANQTQTTTNIRGTKGYVAPEWFKSMPVSTKVDVFSFRVVLLEIICCRKSVEVETEMEEQIILTDWVCDCYKEGRLGMIVEKDYEALNDARRLERLVKVAIWCIQDDPSLRPSMKKVTQMLDGAVEVPIPPDPYSFISALD